MKYPARGKYYIFVSGILAVIGFVLFFIGPHFHSELTYNIVSEIVGIIATIILLMFVIEFREERKWQNVDGLVKKRLGIQLYFIFIFLARFVYSKSYGTLPSREEVIEILEELNEMEKPTLTNHAYQYYFPKPVDKTSVFNLEGLFERKQNIMEIEMKYSHLLKPKLIYSLSEIQNCLNSIKSYFTMLGNYPESIQLQEIVKEAMPKKILEIMKEIHKIHEMRIDIRPKQT